MTLVNVVIKQLNTSPGSSQTKNHRNFRHYIYFKCGQCSDLALFIHPKHQHRWCSHTSTSWTSWPAGSTSPPSHTGGSSPRDRRHPHLGDCQCPPKQKDTEVMIILSASIWTVACTYRTSPDAEVTFCPPATGKMGFLVVAASNWVCTRAESHLPRRVRRNTRDTAATFIAAVALRQPPSYA